MFSPGGLAEGNPMTYLIILTFCFCLALLIQVVFSYKKKLMANPIPSALLGFLLAYANGVNLIFGTMVGFAGWVVFAIAYVIVEYILFKEDKVKPL